jgi:hypothetical protein
MQALASCLPSLLRLQTPVQHPVVDRLVQMDRLDRLALVKVGEGVGDARVPLKI